MIPSDRLWRLWRYSWWVLWPVFFLLVLRFSYERACLDPYELLRPLMRHQSLALLIAAIYLGAHLWIVIAGILMARELIPRPGRTPVALSIDLKFPAMAIVVALEQMPRAVWAWLYHAIGVC